MAKMISCKNVAICAFLVAADASAALAQETRAGPPEASATSTIADADEAGNGRLGDIVVTARRRSESVQQVPIAVSAFDSGYLAQHQITEAFRLTSISPSLQVQSVNSQVGAVNFSIRGIGTAVYGPQVESSVATVIDDVAMGRPQFGILSFFDIDRVEVLRGPQGMLFGKNASAGVVNITTGVPKLGTQEFSARAEYGNMNTPSSGNTASLDVMGNTPLGDTAALRITGFVKRDDGYARNRFSNENLGFTEYGTRVKLLWEPAPNVRFTVAGDYAHEEGPAESVLIRRRDAPGGLIQQLNANQGIIASARNAIVAGDAATSNTFNLWGASLKGEVDLGGGYTLTNIGAYRSYNSTSELDTDSLPINGLNTNTQTFSYWQASDELRITSAADKPLSYQVGLYYLRLSARNTVLQLGNLADLLGPAAPGRSVIGGFLTPDSQSESTAAFAEGKYSLTPSLRITAGIRYTHDDLRYSIDRTLDIAGIPLNPVGSDRASTKIGNISYRVGLDYSLSKDILAYATYSRGYKGPTFDQLTAIKVGKEVPISYELGLKSTLLDRRLRLNLALFDTTFRGFQAQARAPGSALSFITVNAGDLKARGVEAEFTALPTDHLTLSGGVTYNHTKYIGFTGVACYFGQPTGLSGTNVCLPDGTQDVSGNRLQNSPDWTGTATARYERDVSSDLNAFVQSDLYFRSRFNFTSTRDPQTEIEPSAVIGASVGITSKEGGWSFTVFARNLT